MSEVSSHVSNEHGPTHQAGSLERFVTGLPLGIGNRLGPMFSGDGLRAKAMRGSAWTVAGFGTQQVLRLGSNLILTRLLFPEAFGLMALVNVVLQGLQMLSDIGIGASIIQNKRGDDLEFLRTAWTLQIIRGVLLWLGACAIAYPFALFYEDPRLAQMIPVAGLTVLVLGFQTTALPQHNRQMKLGRLTAVQLAGQVLNLAVTILLAWHARSVWALVFGGVSGALVQVALAQALLPGIKHRLHIDRTSFEEIVRFGKWLFIATALAFLASQTDRLILGKLVEPALLGVYSIAIMLASVADAINNRLSSSIVYPFLSEYSRRGLGSASGRIYRTRWIANIIAILLSFLLAIVAPGVFRVLWDERYWAAGDMARFMALSVLLNGLNMSLNAALLAANDSFSSAMMNAIKLTCSTLGMLLGYTFGGIYGLILGIALGHLAANCFLHVRMEALALSTWHQDLSSLAIATVGIPLIILSSYFPFGELLNLSEKTALAGMVWIAIIGYVGTLVTALILLLTTQCK